MTVLSALAPSLILRRTTVSFLAAIQSNAGTGVGQLTANSWSKFTACPDVPGTEPSKSSRWLNFCAVQHVCSSTILCSFCVALHLRNGSTEIIIAAPMIQAASQPQPLVIHTSVWSQLCRKTMIGTSRYRRLFWYLCWITNLYHYWG